MGPTAHTFFSLLLRNLGPPDPLRTQFWGNFNNLSYSHFTWGWTTTKPVLGPLPHTGRASSQRRAWGLEAAAAPEVQILVAIFRRAKRAHPAGNLRFRTGFGPKAGPNQDQNIRHGTHKPAHNDSERFWANLGVFRRRSETCKL